jgi:hypothetical protein
MNRIAKGTRSVELSPDALRRVRCRRQLLNRASDAADAETVVRRLCVLQAQDVRAAGLGVRVRSTGLVEPDVDRARVQERSIVRTWAMRGTLHLLSVEDWLWLRPLLAPRIIDGAAHRSAQLGLDEAIYGQALEEIERILGAAVALTRSELDEELGRNGIDCSGQRMPYLLLRASVEGVICEGPLRGGKPTYVLAGDWLGARSGPLDRDSALERLVKRYLLGYGPAAAEDFAYWSGLPLSTARRTIDSADGLRPVECGGRRLWEAEEAPWPSGDRLERPVCLLPAFDAYLLGYKDRSSLLEPRLARRVNAGGGLVKPAVLVDGRIEGTWKLAAGGGEGTVEVSTFRKLDRPILDGLEEEIRDIGRFLTIPVDVRIAREV